MSTEVNRTPSGEAVTQLFRQSSQLQGLLSTADDEVAGHWGLFSAKWSVLGSIAGASRPLHAAQIGRNMELTRQSVRRIVHELEEGGLVELVENPNHQRARLAQLTRRGDKVYRAIRAEQIRCSNELAGGVSERTIQSALGVIAKLCARITRT